MMQVFYYDWNPWKAIPTGEFDNVLYLAGVTTNFPDCNQILQTYDAEQPLKALINEKVYLVDSEWKTLDQKCSICRNGIILKQRQNYTKS